MKWGHKIENAQLYGIQKTVDSIESEIVKSQFNSKT